MKINEWTLGLAAVGAVSLASVAGADEVRLVPLMTAVSSTTLSGYVDASAIWRPGTGSDAVPVGRLFDVNANGQSKQDGFNLNVVSISLDKPLEEGKWSAGYHVQTLIGPDAAARGTGLVGNPGGEVNLYEAYVKLRAPVGNGLDFQIGQFANFTGYEGFDDISNANYSHSYGYYINAASHVGLTVSYTFSPIISASVGVANDYGYAADSTTLNNESTKFYLGKVVLTAPENFGFLKGSTLTVGYTGGPQASTPVVGASQLTPNNHVNNYYAGAKVNTPIKELSVGASFDYQDAADGYFAHALAGYVTYNVTEKFSLNGRADWAQGCAGSFINFGAPGAGALAADAATEAIEGRPSILTSNEELLGLTLTADYKLWANVMTRAEVRWDHSLNGLAPFDNENADHLQKNELTLALNVIYQF